MTSTKRPYHNNSPQGKRYMLLKCHVKNQVKRHIKTCSESTKNVITEAVTQKRLKNVIQFTGILFTITHAVI